MHGRGTKRRTAGRLVITALIFAVTALIAPVTHAAPAAAAPADCDATGVAGYFKRVGDPNKDDVSFTFNGRAVDLMNESLLDDYNRGQISSGRKSGDSVWVDRTFHTFSPGTYSDAYIQSVVGYGGWLQCGPFSSMTQSVFNGGFASRVCAYIDGTTKCGKWWVDHDA